MFKYFPHPTQFVVKMKPCFSVKLKLDVIIGNVPITSSCEPPPRPKLRDPQVLMTEDVCSEDIIPKSTCPDYVVCPEEITLKSMTPAQVLGTDEEYLQEGAGGSIEVLESKSQVDEEPNSHAPTSPVNEVLNADDNVAETDPCKDEAESDVSSACGDDDEDCSDNSDENGTQAFGI